MSELSSLTETPLSDCPLCGTRLVIQRIIPGRMGLEHWTLRCTRCGHVHQDAVDLSFSSHHAMQVPRTPTSGRRASARFR